MRADWHKGTLLPLAERPLTPQKEERCLQPGWSPVEAEPVLSLLAWSSPGDFSVYTTTRIWANPGFSGLHTFLFLFYFRAALFPSLWGEQIRALLTLSTLTLSMLDSFTEYDRFLAKTQQEKDQKYHCKLPGYLLASALPAGVRTTPPPSSSPAPGPW